MKRGKSILFGIFFIMIIMVSVSYVSANWFSDLFKFGEENPDLEGELPASFGASVQVSNTAPEIKKFVAVFEDDNKDGTDDNAGTSAGTVTGEPGGSEGDGIMNVNFKFVVEDLDGKADLPGYTGGPAIVYGTNLIVEFSAPTNAPVGNTQKVSASTGDCSAATCQGNALCPDQSATTNQVIYTCFMKMNYYNPPSPNGGAVANDRWKFRVKVVDSTNINNDEANSGDAGFNVLNNDYMIYNTINSISVPAGTTVSWNNLNPNTADNKADTNLVLENGGNKAVSTEDIVAKDLVQNGVPANKLLSTAFSVGAIVGGANTGACDINGGGGTTPWDGIALTNNGNPVTFSVAVPYTAAGIATDKNNMYFCIWPVVNPTYLAGSSAKSYVANAANSNAWAVIFKS